MKKRTIGIWMLSCMALLCVCVGCKNNKSEAEGKTSFVEVVAPSYNTYCTLVQDSVKLLPPTEQGMPLMQALKNRRTVRTWSNRQLSDQQISDLLWAAVGVNRPEEGRLTSPTARNAQEITVYLYTQAAIYRYAPQSHSLILVKSGDYRAQAGSQAYYLSAPIALTIVAEMDKLVELGFDEWGQSFYSATDAGYVSQNIYLYCASEGMTTVACGMIDRKALNELLQLGYGMAMLSHPVGFAD